MATHVISHRQPRRKRRGPWSFVLRRFGALAVTVAALATATWLAPYFFPPPSGLAPATLAKAPASPPTPLAPPTAESVRAVSTETLAVRAPRARRARTGVPLDAHPGDAGEDFEILSTTELDAISQASN